MVNDVKQFGALDSYSAFPFESKLGQIKRLLRCGNSPLKQVARRIMELSAINVQSKQESYPQLGKMSNQVHPLLNCACF